MKKTSATMIAWSVCLTVLLSGCAKDHAHSAAGSWNADPQDHWQVCECGETVDKAAHTVQGGICSVCGGEIIVYDDKTAQVIMYNEQGDHIRVTYYSAVGSEEYCEEYEHTYDGSGHILSTKVHAAEQLLFEYEYAQTSDGDMYISKDTYYDVYGGKSVTAYDEHSNILSNYSYDDEGNVTFACEYEYNAMGNHMTEKNYEGDRLICEREYWLGEETQSILTEITYHEDGSWIGIEYDVFENIVIEIHTDAAGKVELDRRYVHDYDAEGNITKTSTYDNGILVEEMEYRFGSDESGSWSMSGKTTTYHEDGSKTVQDSDPDGAWSYETTYAADGTVAQDIRYEYDYDENGDSVHSVGYKNGKLFEEAGRITNEKGEAVGIFMTSYDEDGTKTVCEYNDVFDLVKKTVYDPAGNVISES